MKKQDYIDLYCAKQCYNRAFCKGTQMRCEQVNLMKKAFDAGYNQGKNDATSIPKKSKK